jgi:hypothetical protein
MSRKFGVYAHPNDNPQAHADCVLGLMGGSAPEFCDLVPKPGCDDNRRIEYIFVRPPRSIWGKAIKYVMHKAGIKKFLPVTCSKTCTDCHGRSPGCGRNIEFDKINADFEPSDELLRSLRSPPSETDSNAYSISRYF